MATGVPCFFYHKGKTDRPKWSVFGTQKYRQYNDMGSSLVTVSERERDLLLGQEKRNGPGLIMSRSSEAFMSAAHN